MSDVAIARLDALVRGEPLPALTITAALRQAANTATVTPPKDDGPLTGFSNRLTELSDKLRWLKSGLEYGYITEGEAKEFAKRWFK